MCNQFQWIEEKMMEAYRLAISANAGTPLAAEWKRIGDSLDHQKVEHCVRCTTCQKDLKVKL